MTTLSTHDTKRSDDVRARLAVLSETPGKFAAAAQRWSRMNSSLRTNKLPDRNTEYFYYQTLVGAWPLSVERAQAYMIKAAREAKQKTSWTANNKEFEDALNQFIEATLHSSSFVEKLEQFVERIKEAGRINSLVQTLLKYTVPGVPDLYQGSELWDLSLVDPDNRRPVDYELRSRLLKMFEGLSVSAGAAKAMQHMEEGAPKLWTIHRALLLRRKYPEQFGATASYTPLKVEGLAARHVIAYLRGDAVATVVPRLTLTLGGAWQKTIVQLPEGRWRNWLTGTLLRAGQIAMEALLKEFPVALLVREVESDA
jgi:(1->4)-alpha-D-glucan 1-alpha-D-glucosylmutase